MAATGTEQQYEGAILNQLIKNAERLAVLEQDIVQLKVDVNQLKVDVNQLKADVAELKTDVAELKTDMAQIKPLVVKIEATMNWVKWFLGAIAIGILGNIFSQPILSALHLN
jgi:chromosome segregation ATPase